MKEKGQIWVETVLYTIIILAIITIILGFVLPVIEKQKDESMVEQSINSLKILDEKIKDASKENGNVRIAELGIREGELFIDGQSNKIVLVLSELSSVYSQPGQSIQIGNVRILSTEGKKKSSINISLEYGFNLTYDGKDVITKFSPARIPYKFSIENINGIINIMEASQG